MPMSHKQLKERIAKLEAEQRQGNSTLTSRRLYFRLKKKLEDEERALASDADREMGLDPMAKGEADSFGDHIEDDDDQC